MYHILEKYKINPYKILDIDPLSDLATIKKAYKQKARFLHPDKTKGKTEAEFKILGISYKYAKENCPHLPVATDEELRQKKDIIPVSTNYNLYSFDFENNQERKKVFADDSIDFEDFEKNFERLKNMNTSYTAESFYKKDVLDVMKTNGKFDLDKFNAYFLKLKKQGKAGRQLVKVDRIRAANEYDQYTKVNVYDGYQINTKDEEKLDRDLYELKNEDILIMKNTPKEELDSLLKEHKKDIGKMSTKALKQKMSNLKKKVPVNTEKSFSQLERDIEIRQMAERQQKKIEQRKVVDKYKHVYINTIKDFV